MTYSRHLNPTQTPQSQPIPGKEAQMAQNQAGGYSFAVDEWTLLDRFLILGSEKGTYYASEADTTIEVGKAILDLISQQPYRVIDRIIEISEQGRAPKNKPALFALAVCASAKANLDAKARSYALANLGRVARTPTDLAIFLNEVLQWRKNGRALQTGIQNWYNNRSLEQLTYHALKYRQREGWRQADILRKYRPTPDNEARSALYRYIVRSMPKNLDEAMAFSRELPAQVNAFEQIQNSSTIPATVVAEIIVNNRLTWEMIPTEYLKSPVVWQALLNSIPIGALLRNLARLTANDVLKPMSDLTRSVAKKLTDADALRKARIHPIQILSALLVYQAGKGIRGSLSWSPVTTIVNALDEAFYLSFQGGVQPTGKRVLYGLDVSGSMAGTMVNGLPHLPARTACGAMALISGSVEPDNTAFVAFDTSIYPLTISKRQRLDDVVNVLARTGGGGTDCALPILYAIERNLPVDAFVILTDSQTWAGRVHPIQAIQEYRRKTGILAKLVSVAMATNRFDIGATGDDAGCLTVVGFDTATPNLIADFIRG